MREMSASVGNYSSDLDSIGRLVGADESSSVRGYLRCYQKMFEDFVDRGARVGILGANGAEKLAAALGAWRPDLRVTLLHLGGSCLDEDLVGRCRSVEVVAVDRVEDAGSFLISKGDWDVLVEAGRNFRHEKRFAFSSLFWSLREGGLYFVEDLHAVSVPALCDSEEPDVLEEIFSLVDDRRRIFDDRKLRGSRAELSESIGFAHIEGTLAVVQKRFRHLMKVSEDTLSSPEVKERLGEWSPVVLFRREAERFVSRAVYWSNVPGYRERYPEAFDVPPLEVRRYEDVDVYPRQVVVRGNVFLPETFRLFRKKYLSNSRLRDASPLFARGPSIPSRRLEGDFFYLDSEFIDTYGHTTTELLGRMWGFDLARESQPGLRVLVSSSRGCGLEDLRPWVPRFLEAAGIPADRIEVFNGPVAVERLFSCTPMFSNLGYVAPGIVDVWSRVADALAADGRAGTKSAVEFGDRIFVARPEGYVRKCRNAAEVESLFRRSGFDVVHPEMFDLSDQARLFRGASVVAGYGGSGLINSLMSRPGITRIIIAPETYDAINEALIASALGGKSYYFYCDAEIPHPVSGWSQQAFGSPFTFDFKRDGEALRSVIEDV